MSTPTERIGAARAVLAAEPHLLWACVFGSVARGEAGRDLDIAVMPSPTMPAGAVAWGQLIARLEAATGVKVDLVDLRHAPLPLLGPLLVDRIVVVDRDPLARHRFEADSTSRWLDFKPSYQEAQRIRLLAMQRRLQGTQ
ncbi:MAG: nucleotidyltransferase domain-containing protein [Planctomycetota bacterium]